MLVIYGFDLLLGHTILYAYVEGGGLEEKSRILFITNEHLLILLTIKAHKGKGQHYNSKMAMGEGGRGNSRGLQSS